ncbi:gluconokinase [Celeribacter sp.]|uniref:gluconokinase n=1 Tax=Celeribacter sp. TaxID=1890673 RepID=UPI003A915E8B
MPKLDIIIVAGVSGCGKSTVAKALAETCGYPFLEGDEYHPAENVAAMAAGRPLTDEMRWPWLRRLASSAVEKANGAGGAVVSCSALKRAYRDLLREQTGGCRFVLLTGDRDMIYARMSARANHYMPPTLLDSQFAALEGPDTTETDLVEIAIDGSSAQVIKQAHIMLDFDLHPKA